MRLLLDAHLSAQRIGQVLRERGHDVRAIAEEPELDGTGDPDVFALTARDGRILVTANVKDFDPLLRAWGAEGKSHAGCMLIAYTIRQEHFGPIIARIEAGLLARLGQHEWIDHVEWLARTGRA